MFRYMLIQTVWFIVWIIRSLMRNYFPKRPSGAPLHTLSKLYDVPVGFVIPPPYFSAVLLLYLRSPKGGSYSISDDLSCFSIIRSGKVCPFLPFCNWIQKVLSISAPAITYLINFVNFKLSFCSNVVVWDIPVYFRIVITCVCRLEQKRSTEGCSKFKSPETRQVQERLVSTLEHMQVPKCNRTRCPEE